MRFSRLFVLSSIIVSSFALPAVSFTAELTEFKNKVDSLQKQVTAFPSEGATMDEAVSIHGSARLLYAAIGNYIKGLSRLPTFNKTESRGNLKAAKKLEQSYETALDAIVAKKAAFENLPNANLSKSIIQDVQNLGDATNTFDDDLVAHTHPTHVQEAKRLRDKLAEKFESTVATLNTH